MKNYKIDIKNINSYLRKILPSKTLTFLNEVSTRKRKLNREI